MCGRGRFAILAASWMQNAAACYNCSRPSTGRTDRIVETTAGCYDTVSVDYDAGSDQCDAEKGQLNIDAAESKYPEADSAWPFLPPTPQQVQHVEQDLGKIGSSNENSSCHCRVIENLSPGMEVPVLFFDETAGQLRVESMVWGLIPTYLTAPSRSDHYRMFNKRIESLIESPAPYFQQLVGKSSRRCVVFLDGFYEWKMVAGKKQPYYVHLPDQPLIMAGIYEDSLIAPSEQQQQQLQRGAGGGEGGLRKAKTFSILTGDPSEKFSEIHDRHPTFLSPQQIMPWLTGSTASASTYAATASATREGSGISLLLRQLQANPTDAGFEANTQISFYPVTNKVSNPRYQERDCTVPKPVGLQLTSFFKSAKRDIAADDAEAGVSAAAGETGEASEAGRRDDEDLQKLHAKRSSAAIAEKEKDGTNKKQRTYPIIEAMRAATQQTADATDAREATSNPNVTVDNSTSSPNRSAFTARGGGGSSYSSSSSAAIRRAQSSSAVKGTKPITSFFSRSP